MSKPKHKPTIGILYAGEMGAALGQAMAANGLRVRIEGFNDAKALGIKTAVAQDCTAQATHANQCQCPLALQAKDLAQFFKESTNVVAPALLTKPAEIAEVFANLGRGHAQLQAEIL